MEPISYTQLFELELFPLCVWRESSNQDKKAWSAVAHVIKNRVKKNNQEFGGGNYHGVILKPWAFSSFNHNDPNLGRWPKTGEFAWQHIQSICFDVYHGLDGEMEDPTDGALFFISHPLTEPPIVWGRVEKTLDLGDMKFYRPCPVDMSDVVQAI
jgi:spore germination cell wall hydrolase CwlJ-like protein